MAEIAGSTRDGRSYSNDEIASWCDLGRMCEEPPQEEEGEHVAEYMADVDMCKVCCQQCPPAAIAKVGEVQGHVLHEFDERLRKPLGGLCFQVHGVAEDGDIGAHESIEDGLVGLELGVAARGKAAITGGEAGADQAKVATKRRGFGRLTWPGGPLGKPKRAGCPCTPQKGRHDLQYVVETTRRSSLGEPKCSLYTTSATMNRSGQEGNPPLT